MFRSKAIILTVRIAFHQDVAADTTAVAAAMAATAATEVSLPIKAAIPRRVVRATPERAKATRQVELSYCLEGSLRTAMRSVQNHPTLPPLYLLYLLTLLTYQTRL